ncbi:MAG: hypothetical protein K2N15_11510 [Lachnospiraceae bacterium]|nr:hypothetical protein [Lachnospiraceae bacterium]
MATAIFYLKIENGLLYVEGEIPFYRGYGNPKITLNKNAVVHHMSLNHQDVFQKTVDENNDYFVTYCLEKEEAGNISIKYSTPVKGWYNLISKEVIAISLYSHAFPSNLPDDINDSICYFVKGFEDYELYGAYWDESKELYAKSSKKLFGEIANIIALPKGRVKTYQQDKIRVIYKDNCNCESIFSSIEIGLQAFRYYNEIYSGKELSKVDVVVLGCGEPGSAYIRDNLIVMGEPMCALPTKELQELLTNQMFPHEFGHIWFKNADASTFEDWLNETGAEWSHLLFLLHVGKYELFDKCIEMHYDTHRRLGEEIRPKDLHHPNTVHDSGVVLFHQIYKKYGKEAIVRILQILSNMKQQITEDYLHHIETEYSKEIAEFIRRNLDEKISI